MKLDFKVIKMKRITVSLALICCSIPLISFGQTIKNQKFYNSGTQILGCAILEKTVDGKKKQIPFVGPKLTILKHYCISGYYAKIDPRFPCSKIYKKALVVTHAVELIDPKNKCSTIATKKAK